MCHASVSYLVLFPGSTTVDLAGSLLANVDGHAVLPRPGEPTSHLPMPAGASDDRMAVLARVRQFIDALVRAASTEARRDREVLVDARRSMKQAAAPLFAWHMARKA